MTKKISCHLMDMLAKVPEPRNNKGKRHPLKSILTLIVIELMCGHKGHTSIATWARHQPALARALGFTHKKTPCPATLHNLMKRLDVVAVERTLTQWVNIVIKSRPDLTRCFDAVAIDGKTMRASQKSGATTSHLLSIVSHELEITITQQSVSDKTNEIPISIEILKAVDVSEKVITTDALLTQRTFCQAVIDADGDYMLPVKDNQPDLSDAIERLFQDTPDTLSDGTTHPILREPIHIHETTENRTGDLR